MLLLTLRETYTLNRLSSFQNLRRKGGKFDHRPERPKVLLRHCLSILPSPPLQPVRGVGPMLPPVAALSLSITSFAADETSGVQECTPVDYVNSTDVSLPVCRHSTGLRAWSSSSPARIFLQNTRCSTHTYHCRRLKFCWRRTARVEHFTGYSLRHITSYGRLGNI